MLGLDISRNCQCVGLRRLKTLVYECERGEKNKSRRVSSKTCHGDPPSFSRKPCARSLKFCRLGRYHHEIVFMPVTPILEARALEKSFDGVRALRGVSFDVRAGEVHALVGENGAGKSTLIRALTGAIHPDRGTITVDRQSFRALDPAKARLLGIVPIYQQPALFPDLTVAENIELSRG